METIKEEKKAELEHLLNSLIEKGWKPRGLNPIGKMEVDYDIYFAFDVYDSLQCGHFSFRDLASKESGLRQFVCEKGMINIPGYKNIIRQGVDAKRHKYYGKDYRYWLCESSLKDESEIEDFLLNSIKLD